MDRHNTETLSAGRLRYTHPKVRIDYEAHIATVVDLFVAGQFEANCEESRVVRIAVDSAKESAARFKWCCIQECRRDLIS
jgi:hypothetical protein